MATLGMAITHANILASGLATWQVKWGIGETPDDAFYSLGPLANGSVVANTLATVGEYGELNTYAIELVAKAQMLCTDKTTVLELLHNLGNAQLLHKITAINGKTFHGNFGTKWRFDSSADFNGNRYIEIEANHRFLTAHASSEDLAEVLDTPDADGTSDSGDTLYTWSAATKLPAGVIAFTCDPAGTNETIGKFRNAKLIAELMTTPDEKGRYVGNGIKVTVEADMLQTNTELAYLGANFPAADGFLVTLADGALVGISTFCPITWDYHLEGGAETASFSHLSITRVIKLSEWAGIVA